MNSQAHTTATVAAVRDGWTGRDIIRGWTQEQLDSFRLFTKEDMEALRALIKATKTVGEAMEVRKGILALAQIAAMALLWAEAGMGGLLGMDQGSLWLPGEDWPGRASHEYHRSD